MKKQSSKISLSRETLCNLTDQHLQEAKGGNFTGRNTFCPSICRATCVTACNSMCHCTVGCN